MRCTVREQLFHEGRVTATAARKEIESFADMSVNWNNFPSCWKSKEQDYKHAGDNHQSFQLVHFKTIIKISRQRDSGG